MILSVFVWRVFHGLCTTATVVLHSRLVPAEYLEWIRGRIDDGGYDVLFPVHDQVLLLAKYRNRFLDVGLAVPSFESVRTVQSKPGFARKLEELGLPQPSFVLARTARELEPPWGFPCFVKTAYSTAGQGVWRVENRSELANTAERLAAVGCLNAEKEALVQQPGVGEMSVVQAVFQDGKLVGHSLLSHLWWRCRRKSPCPRKRQPSCRGRTPANVGRSLSWHGALHAEYFYESATRRVQFIELNPRIGETFNATLAGVNLCELMLQVSCGATIKQLQVSRPGVRSHNLMLRLLGVAEQGLGRRRVLSEMVSSLRRQNEYANSEEELMRMSDDLPSLLPTTWVALQLLALPGCARRIVHTAMQNVSLSEAAVREMIDM